MVRCCNLKTCVDRSSVAPRVLRFTVLLVLATTLAMVGASTMSFSQSGSNSLPEDVADMRESLLEAAETGTLEAIGVAIELSELTPEFGGAEVDATDPVRAFASLASSKLGSDPPVRDVEALFKEMQAVLGQPFAREGGLYVWPAMALRSAGPLTAAERAAAVTFMNGNMISEMAAGGPYRGLRIDIGHDGTWHFIGRNGISASE